MRDNTLAPLFIFALNVTDDKEKELKLAKKLCGTEYVRALKGCYKGATEVCYLVEQCDVKDFEVFKTGLLASNKGEGQETILYIDNQRNASLLHKDNFYSPFALHHAYLGQFKAVPEDYALKQEAWTRCPLTSSYYVAE